MFEVLIRRDVSYRFNLGVKAKITLINKVTVFLDYPKTEKTTREEASVQLLTNRCGRVALWVKGGENKWHHWFGCIDFDLFKESTTRFVAVSVDFSYKWWYCKRIWSYSSDMYISNYLLLNTPMTKEFNKLKSLI